MNGGKCRYFNTSRRVGQDGALPQLFCCCALILSLSLAPTASAQFPAVVDLSQTSADKTVLGALPYDKTGFRLASGDFDGDGNVDVVVLSEGQLGSNGYAFFHILWGDSPLPTAIDLAGYSGHVSIVRAINKEVGTASWITTADFNCDGLDDIALGLPCRDPFINCDGKAYVIFGSSTFPDSVYLESPSMNVTIVYGIVNVDGALGRMITTGDVNGDTYDDLVIAAAEIQTGSQIYVVFGQESLPATIDLNDQPENVTYLIDPRYAVKSGHGMACGDVNRDGFDDLLIGSSGEAMLVMGASEFPDTMLLTDSAIKRFYGPINGWRTDLADFNGDLYLDIVMSASWDLHGPGCQEDCGGVFVAYVGECIPDSIDLNDPSAAVTRMFGAGVAQMVGWELASGDVNGDGCGDILVSSQPDDYDQSDVGKVTIVYGSPTPPDTVLLGTDTTVTRILAEARPDFFASGLHASDINADGAADVLIGAEWATALGRTRAGKAYILNGIPVSTPVKNLPPTRDQLLQNYPNPFNPATTIPLRIAGATWVNLSVYDVRGSLVRTLVNSGLAAGRYDVSWDGIDNRGRPVASGVYFCRLVTPHTAVSRKILVVR